MIQGIGDHLWQSTWFAGAAFLASLMLRPNRAQSRYWVWFAASVKFLIPFSLLAGLGAHIPHPVAAPPIRAGWVAAFQQLSQPLTLPPVTEPAAVPVHPMSHVDLAAAGSVVWACGFLAVVICWLFRWRRFHVLRTSARVLNLQTSLPIPAPVMSAPDLVEPGVVGILRPVLLLPEGIADQLNQAQLDAILTHEFCHMRRRDNLTAAIHMAVQAIFWFHPLTWWIGARLVAERERACDEEVLHGGCKANVYAESILAVCRLYLASPLACISGVTGSNLKRRIEQIMRNRKAVGLNLGKKLVLTGAGIASLVVPLVIGALNAPAFQAQGAPDWQTKAGGKMAFDVASVKLSKGPFVSPNVPINVGEGYRPTGGYFRADFPLWTYIQFAYKIAPAEDQSREILAHLPKWAATDRYSIDARGPANATKDQMRLMVQALLAERFQFAAHFETKEAAVFNLTLAKSGTVGPKLRPHAEGPPCDAAGFALSASTAARVIRGDATAGPENFPDMCDSFAVIRKAGGALMLVGYRNATMDMLAASLTGIVGEGRPVIDKTGLSGRYDFTMEWAPQTNSASPPDAPTTASEPLGPTSLQALRDELGLKLESARGPVRILVIDKVERPSEN
ncbi:MAG TPA: M56 family metallopeptidase [Bryobacteraceae bacterium]